MNTDTEIKAAVRERYAAIARTGDSCCGPGPCGCGPEMAPDGLNVIGDAYAGVAGRLAEADLNLGCGVPTRHAALQPGETVLDLGSGAGTDAFIARHEVGADGRRRPILAAMGRVHKTSKLARGAHGVQQSLSGMLRIDHPPAAATAINRNSCRVAGTAARARGR